MYHSLQRRRNMCSAHAVITSSARYPSARLRCTMIRSGSSSCGLYDSGNSHRRLTLRVHDHEIEAPENGYNPEHAGRLRFIFAFSVIMSGASAGKC